MKRQIRWLLVCLIVLALLVGLSFIPAMRPHVRYATEYVEAFLQMPQRFTEVAPNQLIADYATDNVRATDKWTGESVSLRGAVLSGSLDRESHKWKWVLLVSPLQSLDLSQPSVCCIMESPQTAPIELVGKIIHVTGVCQGVRDLAGDRSVVIAHCRIVP